MRSRDTSSSIPLWVSRTKCRYYIYMDRVETCPDPLSAPSVLSCVRYCTPPCASFFYHKEDKKCLLSEKIFRTIILPRQVITYSVNTRAKLHRIWNTRCEFAPVDGVILPYSKWEIWGCTINIYFHWFFETKPCLSSIKLFFSQFSCRTRSSRFIWL